MAKDILRLTEKKVAVKVSGTNVTETITLATDLLAATQVVDGTPKVNILSFICSGVVDSIVTVTRAGKTIIKLHGGSAAVIDFSDMEFVDNVNNTADLVITTTGDAQLYMNLRKESGYKSKIETPEFGPYDNPNLVGE